MKFGYLLGERTPNRSAQEFVDLQYNKEIIDLRADFLLYFRRFYPGDYFRFCNIWELKVFFMRWPNKQSSFLIAIVNDRSQSIVGLYPTFKKAVRALRVICKDDSLIDRPF